jgi:DNA invertase Pin-like site-specific DNA recombinase
VVPKVDRLGRDTIDISETANLVHTLGVRLLFLDINVDTRSAMGRAFMQIAAVFAELERNRIRERILEALATKRGKGQLTGTLPYGWDAEPTGETTPKGVPIRRLVPNLTEQRWILHMHAMRAAGGSYYAIAQKLNELGCPTKRAGEVLTLRGKNKTTAPGIVRSGWRSGNVQKVLTNQTVQSWLASQAAQAAAA